MPEGLDLSSAEPRAFIKIYPNTHLSFFNAVERAAPFIEAPQLRSRDTEQTLRPLDSYTTPVR